VGGQTGFGPVPVPVPVGEAEDEAGGDEAPFHADWEARVYITRYRPTRSRRRPGDP
jgi:hypothetical protein